MSLLNCMFAFPFTVGSSLQHRGVRGVQRERDQVAVPDAVSLEALQMNLARI